MASILAITVLTLIMIAFAFDEVAFSSAAKSSDHSLASTFPTELSGGRIGTYTGFLVGMKENVLLAQVVSDAGQTLPASESCLPFRLRVAVRQASLLSKLTNGWINQYSTYVADVLVKERLQHQDLVILVEKSYEACEDRLISSSSDENLSFRVQRGCLGGLAGR